MYARMGKTTHGTTEALEVCTLQRLAGTDELVLSLWATREEAAADPAAEWYEVEADQPGKDRDATPAVAALIIFDGPVSDPVHKAAQRAGLERLGPALVEHPGTIRTLPLWQPERRSLVVVALATSMESMEDRQRVIMATELLPGEDPALLPGPDRIDLYRVLAATVGSTR